MLHIIMKYNSRNMNENQSGVNMRNISVGKIHDALLTGSNSYKYVFDIEIIDMDDSTHPTVFIVSFSNEQKNGAIFWKSVNFPIQYQKNEYLYKTSFDLDEIKKLAKKELINSIQWNKTLQ